MLSNSGIVLYSGVRYQIFLGKIDNRAETLGFEFELLFPGNFRQNDRLFVGVEVFWLLYTPIHWELLIHFTARGSSSSLHIW